MKAHVISTVIFSMLLAACSGTVDPNTLIPPGDRALLLAATQRADTGAAALASARERTVVLVIPPLKAGDLSPLVTHLAALAPERLEVEVPGIDTLDAEGVAGLAHAVETAHRLAQAVGLSEDKVSLRLLGPTGTAAQRQLAARQ